MNFFKTFIHFFVSVTTAVVFISGLDAATSTSGYIPKYTLLQILAASAVTALVTAIMFSYSAKTKKQHIIQRAIHFVILCIVMVTMGMLVGWLDKTPLDAFIMCIYVAVVYAIVEFISYLLLKQEADEFNKAINERRKNRK